MTREMAALVLVALGGCAGRRVEEGRGDPTPATGQIAYHQHQIFVPVVIDGHPAGEGLIDTGANACAVDDDLAARLGLGPGTPSEVHGTAGVVTARTVSLGSVSILGAEVRGVAATVYDLGHGATPSGESLAIIIGYPFLKQFAVEVDYTSHRMTLHRRAVSAEHSVPMRLDDGIPLVHVSLNGGPPTPFRVDTGASLFDTDEVYLNITRTVADELVRTGQDPKPVKTFSGGGVGGSVTLPVLQLKSISFGGRAMDKPFAITQPPQGIFADPATPGFIANYTLDGFGCVVFDYLDGTLDLPKR